MKDSKMRSHRLLPLLFGACLALPGCYRTTVVNGAAASPPSLEYGEKWHHGAVLGIVELSGPYNLEKICPNGWAEIATETSFLNGFVQAVVGLYNPQTVTVKCAKGAGNAPPKSESTSDESETESDEATTDMDESVPEEDAETTL